jgi:hypothetical protein
LVHLIDEEMLKQCHDVGVKTIIKIV